MKNVHTCRRGFTLLELMAYMALLGLLLTIIYSVYYQFSRTLSAADATLIKERSVFDMVRWLQNDIRRSKEVAESFGPFRASDGILILLADGEETPEEQVIIYKREESRKVLVRYQTAANGEFRNATVRSLGHDIEKFEFSVAKENPKLVRVSFLVKEGPLGILRNRPMSFHAMMRNG